MKRVNLGKAGCKLGRDTGFTLIEIAVVIAIVAVLAGVAIVRFGSTEEELVASAAQRIVSDIAYTQEQARINNNGTVINFYGSGGGGGGGGCFVATVCYGERSQQVATFRGFRNRVLNNSRPGRAFIRWYYREGPALARVVKGSPALKTAVRAILLPVALIMTPFAGDAYAFGGGGGGDDLAGDPNTYSIRFQDGSWIENPEGPGNYIVSLGDRVTITSPDEMIKFDSSGKESTPELNWGANQTSKVVVTLNDSVNIRIARHTGKTWVD